MGEMVSSEHKSFKQRSQTNIQGKYLGYMTGGKLFNFGVNFKKSLLLFIFTPYLVASSCLNRTDGFITEKAVRRSIR